MERLHLVHALDVVSQCHFADIQHGTDVSYQLLGVVSRDNNPLRVLGDKVSEVTKSGAIS